LRNFQGLLKILLLINIFLYLVPSYKSIIYLNQMKKKIYLHFVFAFLLFANPLFASELTGQEAQQKIKGAEKIITGDYSDIPEFIQFRQESRVSFQDFNNWAHKAFALSADYGFRLLNTTEDELGMTHYRYQQTFHGYDVEGTMFIVHVKNNMISSMNGVLFNQINAMAASLNEASALSKALDYMKASLYRWQNPQMEQQLKEQTNNQDATWFPKGELMLAPYKGNMSAENYRLCWRFDVFAEKPLKREYVFVNASTGEVIYTVNRIHDIGATGTAVTAYSGTRTINTDSVNATTFHLRESVRGNGIETYNLQQGTTYTNTDFLDADDYWNNVNAQWDQYATDAHWGAEMTYDFYHVKFNRNSIDNAGLKLLSYVHYSTGFLNAFWDGTEMTYGDGSTGYTPLTSLDITGHEITHGFTQFTSNLTGGNEPGALNEGFSDCMGASIRHYGKQSSSIDWIMGDEIGGAPFRDMSNPKNTGNPDTYLGTNWDFAQEVHQNSTILSHCYYLLTEGGSGTNDNGNAYSVTGIGIEEAQQIWYRLDAVYLTPSSGYANARAYSIQAAIDIYGACTNEVIQLTNAWYAVGVGNAFIAGVTSDFVAPVTVFCSIPATVNFTNTSNNAGTFIWDFGDGFSSTASNPTHVYNTYGHYTVSLIANGAACGIDTTIKALYISVSTTNPCIVSLPTTGTGPLQNACAGQLYDDGGPSGNYSDQTDVNITIAPTGASKVTLTFSAFGYENTYDFLYIYDGPNTSSPLIGQYTGTALPNGGTIVSTSSSVTIREVSDQNVNDIGFALTWQCSYATSPPVANFSAATTSTCTGIVQFTDMSTNGPTGWSWTFGDGGTSTQQNPTHTYTTSGTYTVVLIASNSFGNDTIIQTNYIHVNLPVAPSVTATTVCSGSTATLNASGSPVLSWFTNATGGTAIDTGSVFTTPTLTNTTTYYVESDVYSTPMYANPVDNTFGSGTIFALNNYHQLYFDCYSPVTLVSVKVYAQGAGNRTITLIQNTVTLQSLTVNIPDGTSRVTLNFPVPVGTQFELGIAGNVNLFRNNAGASFPYTLSGLISITGTNAGNAGYYYYFYDWELQTPPCISARVPVTATVTPIPTAGFNSNISANNGSFTDNSLGATSYHWNFGDPASGANDSSSLQNPTHIFSGLGSFQVCLTVKNAAGCSNSICKTVNITSLGVAQIGNYENISVYPNPVSQELTIEFPVALSGEKWLLKLTDILGKVIEEKTVSPSTPNITSHGKYNWDLSQLSPGTYILILQNEHEKIIRKIVRE